MDGEVVASRVFTVGASRRAARVLLEIVLRADPGGRGAHPARGREPCARRRAADIRLTTYKARETPLVQGEVSYVAGDRMVDAQTGAPYYVVQVAVPPDALAAAGHLKLQAGMPAEVYIRTDERSALDYLLAPVTAFLRRSMREPL
jgi:hypothetical protein